MQPHIAMRWVTTTDEAWTRAYISTHVSIQIELDIYNWPKQKMGWLPSVVPSCQYICTSGHSSQVPPRMLYTNPSANALLVGIILFFLPTGDSSFVAISINRILIQPVQSIVNTPGYWLGPQICMHVALLWLARSTKYAHPLFRFLGAAWYF
jgi:hypothetical protein